MNSETHEGSVSCYTNNKCREPQCKAAWASYMRERNAKIRDKKRAKCSVEGCLKGRRLGGRLCVAHDSRLQRLGEVGSAETRTYGTADIKYIGMHQRIYRTRGKASDYFCTFCGKPAAEWALNHDAEVVYGEPGRLYSVNVNDYIPLCASDHRTYDWEARKAAEIAMAA